ncbi:MAG: PEP/pyruvate-binding domain-containing protein [Desulfobulbaceae bacterium]
MNRLLRQVLTKIGVRREENRPFSSLFREFKEILALNNRVLELIADTNDKLGGDYIFDQQFIRTACEEICDLVEKMVFTLDTLAHHRFAELHSVFVGIRQEIEEELLQQKQKISTVFIMPYGQVRHDDVDAVGGKNANLAELGNRPGLRIPRGFAVTAAAFHAVLEYNGLLPFIAGTLADWQAQSRGVAEVSQQIRQRIQEAVLPKKLRRDLHEALANGGGEGAGSWALRSSGLGEDSVRSFAGQYTSCLNIRKNDVEKAYLQVLAGLYNESALVYRNAMGFKESEVAMPVACQEMIDAQVSGVMYTYDPRAPHQETLLIDATWGLGGLLVSGEVRPDHYVVRRQNPSEIIGMEIVRKERALRPLADGGTGVETVAAARQTVPCLTREQITVIARAGLAIEKQFKKPQDIEFALDSRGELVILQARPLIIRTYSSSRPDELARGMEHWQVLLRGRGEVAQQGIALGPVFMVRRESDLAAFPDGSILVAPSASPLYARVLPRAAGLITAVGSATGHLATIARELRLPAIVNCGEALRQLAHGMEITMDAEENVIYAGLIRELQYYSLNREPLEETYEYRLLRRVLRKIEPLHLLDPSENNFVPRACTSLHDITRFVHEKAVATLIDFHFYNHHAPGAGTARLTWDIPLDLDLLDIGGGIRAGAGKRVAIDEVESAPMRAILQGLALPGAWDNEPVSVDLGGFMSSLTRTLAPELATPKHLGRNLAVVSAEYANISLRLGYHFTMVDAYVSERSDDNSIYFRFFGGVTGDTRRGRRARFLEAILAEHDFRVEVHGDFVVGRIKKLTARDMLSRLVLLGVLIGYTRQLDALMVNEQKIADTVQRFKTLMEADNEQNQHPHPGR